MSRRSTGGLGCLVPKQRVDVFRNGRWLEAEVESVVVDFVNIIFWEQGSKKRKKLHVHDNNLRIPSDISCPHVEVTPPFRQSFLVDPIAVPDEEQPLSIGDTVKVLSVSGGNRWLEAEVVNVLDEDGGDKVIKVLYHIDGTPRYKCLKTSSRMLKEAGGIDTSMPDTSPSRKWSHRVSRQDKVNDQERPLCLAQDVEVSGEMKKVQRECPCKWAMTLGQWNEFIETCKQSTLWTDIKQRKGYVNLHDLNEYFVIPWSKGTGCSIAILMTKGQPLEAVIMLSHSWSEDMEECQDAVKKHFKDEGISADTPVWFCGFALYQPEDGCGPWIEQQIELNPFTEVISSENVKSSSGRMIAVHTSKADLYGSLWCVREVREAMSQKVKITAAMSMKAREDFKNRYKRKLEQGAGHKSALMGAGVTVETEKAKCRDEDEDMLFKELYKHCKDGDLKEIDETVMKKRVEMLSDIILEVLEDQAMKAKPNALVDFAMEGRLEAVDVLFKVAENGNGQACDELYKRLDQSIAGPCLKYRRYTSISIFAEPAPQYLKLQLAVVLLQIMAQRDHEQSYEFLLKLDSRGYTSFYSPQEKAVWRQGSFPMLQTLAQQGNHRAAQQAVKELLDRTFAEPQRIGATNWRVGEEAIRSLAWHWNRWALKALLAIDEKHDARMRHMANSILHTCREALRANPEVRSAYC